MKAKDRIIVALDVGDAEASKGLLDKLYPTIKFFKIGSLLFTAAGKEAVSMIKRKGARCFLDLKFHDIPSIVAGAAGAAVSMGIDMFNVHTLGGLEMMKQAAESSKEVASRLKIDKPLLVGVTVLTSMDKRDLRGLGIKKDLKDVALSLAELAKRAGLDGVVASTDEIELIKKNLGKDFLAVTPGIRPSWAEVAEQKRVATPKEAFERGADYIVIGRPITESEDPKAAAERIIEEVS